MSSTYNSRETEAWRLYQLGVNYNNQLEPNQYSLVDTNIEFFVGNQWKGLGSSSAMAALPKPVFNIIKRVTSLFVASLTSSATKVSFEPLTNKMEHAEVFNEDMQQRLEEENAIQAAKIATDEVANLFDKLKMDYRIRDALFDGAQTGDYCAHFYWDAHAKPYGGAYGAYRGEIAMEIVDGINVMFGNPNTADVEAQPYILIVGRDTVENLRAEYKNHHPSTDVPGEHLIQPDKNYNYQAASGGKIELGDDDKTGKAIFVYYYSKKRHKEKLWNDDGTPKMENAVDSHGKPIQDKSKDGLPMFDAYGYPVYKQVQAEEWKETVHVSKHTQYATIFDDTDTGLSYYPIAWGNWERQKNQYHGRALVTGIIPNQIYINSMFALVMRHQQLLGFPKTLYDANVIGQWNNAVGQAIAVYDLPPDKRISDLHSVIQPADMSTQIMACIDRAIALTKECLGATDAQLGNVRPDNTSAIIALQSSSQVPLENPQAIKYEWVEDIGRILLDMMGTYYGKRPVVRTIEQTEEIIDPSTGQPTVQVKKGKVVEMYDFNKLKNLWLNVRADVGASTYWSRIAVVQTLDNLKVTGVLDVLDYLERMPDEYIPRKEELLAKLRQQASLAEQQQQVPPELLEQAGIQNANAPAFDASMEPNDAAVVASMPDNIQQLYNNLGTRQQKTLQRQTKLNTVGL